MKSKKGLLVVLSAPSGCGKDTVFKELCKRRRDCVESISATTRKPREGEVEGINYFFKTEDEFCKMIQNDELLEYARYNNCYYGTPVDGIKKAVDSGKVCFLIIEVQGARSIMKLYPECVSVFLLPPNMEILRKRLQKRETNDTEDINRRMELAKYEIELSSIYDYTVVNDSLEDAVDEINEIIDKELQKMNNSL